MLCALGGDVVLLAGEALLEDAAEGREEGFLGKSQTLQDGLPSQVSNALLELRPRTGLSMDDLVRSISSDEAAAAVTHSCRVANSGAAGAGPSSSSRSGLSSCSSIGWWEAKASGDRGTIRSERS
jgi:hypothetical protein